MTNNDIFKKLRVALMLRDDQIVEILELVDFRITKSEIGAFFRDEKHENYVECGDQILRNFLNGLVIHLRGTKENPKNPNDVLAKHRSEIPKKTSDKPKTEFKPKTDFKKKTASNNKKVEPKVQVVEKVRFNNGKAKK
ncbi:DUF1456 family protein [Flavobacterium psychrophilum]|uniref:DUF1456 family protein n=1 Tax=Flavobacterium psychrophilum TaxID=96345 RepID=UPI000B7C4B40|nr:DUF1456 family protein [Flavobacterium psychrophilum]MCB6087761.1 DUF1456 family protein [Flavobacterium psychrophilum]SNB15068.1 conserved hypothetical protein [Flavobacterium psychrophilum]